MGQKKVRRTYSEEFKANAVKISIKPGVSVSQVAEELDVSVGYLSKWRSDARVARDQASAEARVDAISENARLKDENKHLKMELEIVKKSSGLLCEAKVSHRSSSRKA